MNKTELVSYLNGLIGLMGSREDAGRPRGTSLGREYDKHYNMVMEIVRKEHEEDEARQRKDDEQRSQERANSSRGSAGSGQSDRSDQPNAQADVRGPGVRSSEGGDNGSQRR